MTSGLSVSTSAIRTSRFARFFVVPVTLLALLSGCFKWTTWEGPDALHSYRHLPERVRVTYEMGGVESTITLRSASVVGDSLIGTTVARERRFEDPGEPPHRRIAIPLADIMTIEERVRDPVGTALLAPVGIAIVALVTWGLIELVQTLFLPECIPAPGASCP